MSETRVSILICTRNRAVALRQTLESIARCFVPADLPAELLVLDNGSTDDTARVVAESHFPNLPMRRVLEPQVGQCFARNRGLVESQGDIILFTDDDVRVPIEWIERMCRPIALGQVQAVSGGVHLAPDLQREWMQPMHRGWLAEVTRSKTLIAPRPYLVGANMAFSKAILSRIPAFDTELGPGQSGFGDDGLFALQLGAAGFRVMEVEGADVEHHCDPSRLAHSSFIASARKLGRTEAYLAHHWEHRPISMPRLRYWKHMMQLAVCRLVRARDCLAREGAAIWELELVKQVALYRHYLRERFKPRKYDLFGLVKKAS